MKAFRINIVGLSNKIHHFQFDVAADFFLKYGAEMATEGEFKVDLALDKRETFLEADFTITGIAKLVCDRTLEPFDYPIKKHHKLIFKYGEKDEEISDEIVIINRETTSLELGHFIFEFITLGIPIKKLHPKFQDETDDGEEGKLVYTTEETAEEKNTEEVDPRWNILKKLK